jgi:uncharacterized protein (TIGR02246 family)
MNCVGCIGTPWTAGTGAGAEAFVEPFDADCDFIAFDGTRCRGRDEIVRFHDQLFKTHLKGTRLIGDVTDVRFIGSDVAVVHAYGGTVPRGKSAAAPERDSVQTLVAIRQGGRWRFVAFQNTRVRPIGQNAPGTLMWLVSDVCWRWCLPKGHARPTMTPDSDGVRAEVSRGTASDISATPPIRQHR